VVSSAALAAMLAVQAIAAAEIHLARLFGMRPPLCSRVCPKGARRAAI
jgi:hypothetical protein